MALVVSSAADYFVAMPAASSQFAPSGQPTAKNIHQQEWQLTLSGVVILESDDDPPVQGFPGTSPDDWTRTTVTVADTALDALTYLIRTYDIPVPAFPFTGPVLNVSQIAPFAAVSSSFLDSTTDAGFAVDAWRPAPYVSGQPWTGPPPLPHPATGYQGVNVDIAVRNNLSTIYRLSYQVTMTGVLAYLAGQL